MRLSEAYDNYIKIKILGKGRSTNTFRIYQQNKRNAVGFFGDVRLWKVQPEKIAEYYLALVNTTAVNGARHLPSTASRAIGTLKTVLEYQAQKGHRTCQIADIEVPRGKARPPKWLEKQDVERLIECAATSKRGYAKINQLRNELIIRLLFVSGIRIGELVALDRDSIKGLEFIVTGKSKHPRVCFITEEIRDLIERYLALRTDNSPALFIGAQHSSERLTEGCIRGIFRRVAHQCGLDGVHPHTMRHSFATYMLDNGVNIRQVAAMLGHESIETTRRYTHVKNSDLKQVHKEVMSKKG